MEPIKHPWVVIPTYNERDNIERLIRELFALLIDNVSVCIVDDSSPDGTGDIVKRLMKEFPHLHLETREKKSGLGRAYVHGFSFALEHGADAIVQMDADFSHDPKDILVLLKSLTDADLVVGSRYVNGISVVNWPLRRLLISLGGNWYARLITGIPIQDATGGFKAWRAQTLQDIDFKTVDANGYGFQIVMNYRTWSKKKQINEVPIVFTERRDGQSKMSSAIIREALVLVWRLRFLKK